MESFLPQYQDKFDHGVMDKFLNLSELPIIGSSALEQILHQASLDYPAQAQMSPDSSQWTQSSSGVESGSESLDGRGESDLDCLPDSTVKDIKEVIVQKGSEFLKTLQDVEGPGWLPDSVDTCRKHHTQVQTVGDTST